MDKTYTSHFEENLWTESVFGARSSDMSPLYIDRYCGPRVGTKFSSHDFWEFTCCLEGEGTLLSEDLTAVRKNIVCLIPPGLAHREESGQALDTIWIGFVAGKLPCSSNSVLAVEDAGLCGFIERTWLFAGSRGLPIGPELDGRIKTTVAWFLRVLGRKSPRIHENLSQRAIEYLERNLRFNHSMESLASQFKCSEGHLHRSFKRETGKSPIAYLKAIRMKRGAHLLENGKLSVAQVSNLCGFTDPYHFSRVFKGLTGHSPSDYRRGIKG